MLFLKFIAVIICKLFSGKHMENLNDKSVDMTWHTSLLLFM